MAKRLALVVDDEPPIRALVVSILQRDDFDTVEAEDGVTALEIARKLGSSLAVIVSDIQMPKMNGVAMAQAIKVEFPSVAVLLVSCFGFDAENCRDLECIQKPFLPNVLLSKVRQLVGPRKPSSSAGEISRTGTEGKTA